MLQSSAELLALSVEPALLTRGGRILFANETALTLLGRDCREKSVSALFGDEIAGMQAPAFVGETELDGRRVLLRVNAVSGMRAIFLSECGRPDKRAGDAFLFALRSEMMNLSACAAALRRQLDADSGAALDAFCCAAKSFYRINRILRNISVVRDVEDGSISFLPQPLELCSLLQQTADSVRLYTDTPEIRLDLPAALPISGDAQLLELMVLNLLSNCLRHAAASCIRIRLQSVGEQIILSVNDDGCGIPAGQLSTALERFRAGCTLGELGHGPGLGLSAVRYAARLHGGTLLLESRENLGTAVRVSLSRAPRGIGSMCQPGIPYSISSDSVLTGLADCLPPEAFADTFLE